jgi:hypothetical protein
MIRNRAATVREWLATHHRPDGAKPPPNPQVTPSSIRPSAADGWARRLYGSMDRIPRRCNPDQPIRCEQHARRAGAETGRRAPRRDSTLPVSDDLYAGHLLSGENSKSVKAAVDSRNSRGSPCQVIGLTHSCDLSVRMPACSPGSHSNASRCGVTIRCERLSRSRTPSQVRGGAAEVSRIAFRWRAVRMGLPGYLPAAQDRPFSARAQAIALL